MGYSVYETEDHRWGGYGVPAECDRDDCHVEINRGLGYKCEVHGHYVLMLDGKVIDYDRFDDEPDAEEEWVEAAGCGLYFCDQHLSRIAEHVDVMPKSDSAEWVRHMLADDSWQQWRDENPASVAKMTMLQAADEATSA